MRDQPFFHIDHLEKALGAFRLGPLSLELERGEYLVLLGPTGCGKSSLLKAIALGGSRGELFLDGVDIGRLPPGKRGVGMVAQSHDLFPHLSVAGNVAFGLRYLRLTRAERDRKLNACLELFGLRDLADQPAVTLSGGEEKKTALARCLVVEPRLLLLDEPLGSLDHNGRRLTLETLRLAHAELKTTTIHVTHDRQEAWSLPASCAVMAGGQVLERGGAEQVFRRPETLFGAKFLGGGNIFAATLRGATAAVPWGELALERPVAEDGPGHVIIRPELVRRKKKPCGAAASGKVSRVADRGDYLEVAVAVASGCELLYHALPAKPPPLLGETVFLAWPPGAVRALRATV